MLKRLSDFGEPGDVFPVRCPIAKLQSILDADDGQVLDRWLADVRTYTGTWIAASLTLAGYPVSASAVQRHRRRVCACSREAA